MSGFNPIANNKEVNNLWTLAWTQRLCLNSGPGTVPQWKAEGEETEEMPSCEAGTLPIFLTEKNKAIKR